ncbi:MAG: DNA polymerase I, partial [Ignavibacteriae bacterium]|nr:DNA polymerase I [Ignavibacteriota bacterium]
MNPDNSTNSIQTLRKPAQRFDQNPERLFLLDGMALAYRAYYAFISRPLINSKGVNTSAIYGFTTALMRILEDEKPEHIAVVFDTKTPTFRHAMFKDYKATRQKMPEDMAGQMNLLKDVVRAFHVPVIEEPGYEADDVIGTLARVAEKEKVVTYMVTGDKDFMQLITPFIKILRPGKAGEDAEVVDEQGVLQKFGVKPEQVTDVLGLIGDKSDNVPGVPGIGEKTAIPLIQKYGSMEELYEHVGEIPQKGLREKLINNRELAFLSKKLVTIHTDVAVRIDFHGLKANTPDTSALVKYFGELEFRSLANKFAGIVSTKTEYGLKNTEALTPAQPQSITDINSDEHVYHCVTSPNELDLLAKKLGASDSFVLHVALRDRDPLRTEVIGIAFALQEREAYYIPVQSESGVHESTAGDLFSISIPEPLTPNPTHAGIPLNVVFLKLKPILENPSIKKIGQNIKCDMLALHAHGVDVQGAAFDPMVANYILRADGQHTLEAMAMEHFSYRLMSYEEVVGKGKSQRQIADVPVELLTNYYAQQADAAFRLCGAQRKKLADLEQLKLCEELEFPLVSVLARMEAAGVTLDVEYLATMSKELERQIDNLVKEIYRDAGGQFNINSTQQLGDVLFNKL